MDFMDEDYDAPLFEASSITATTTTTTLNRNNNKENNHNDLQQKLIAPSEHDISDSEDEALSSLADRDQFEGLNLPSRMKDILLLDRSDTFGNGAMHDDESDSDLEGGPLILKHTNKLDINKLNAQLAQNKNKFANFPMMRPTDKDEENDEKMTRGKKKAKGTSADAQQKKKKKRRRPIAAAEDKVKERMELLEQEEESRRQRLEDLFDKLRQEGERQDEDSDETDAIMANINNRLMNGASKSNKKKKKRGRMTRKKASTESAMDENGEQMYRSTELLDDTSSSEEEEEEGTSSKLSKRKQLEMFQEAERRRRLTKVNLKPVYNAKSFDDLVKRHEAKELEYRRQLDLERLKAQQQPQDGSDDDSDSSLEIIYKPSVVTPSAFQSPERARFPIATGFSPIRREGTSVLRRQNQLLISRIINEGYQQRMRAEQKARASGKYLTPTQRAEQLLKKEMNAKMINEEVKRHLEKQKQQQDKDYELEEDEEDEDYQDVRNDVSDDDHDEDMDTYSAAENEDEDEDEDENDPFEIQDVDEARRLGQNNNRAGKRKFSHMHEAVSSTNNQETDKDNSTNQDDDDEEEESMAAAFKRWKGKKLKKSTLFDDDSEEEDKPSSNKKAPSKPEPAHSILNFFKAKDGISAKEDIGEARPLRQLTRRSSKGASSEDEDPSDAADKAVEEEPKTDIAEDMDIDEADETKAAPTIPVSATKKPHVSLSKNEYFEAEAEEEEDEFFGVAGEDEEDGEDLDEYEKDDLLVEDNNEQIDEAALREAFNKQDKESDENMINRLITDITSGGLRKQKAAAAAGLLLEDVELYDDDDLVAIRRQAEARRRRMLKKRGLDTLEKLSNNPKTAAFAKAAEPIADTVPIILSDNDEEEEDEKDMVKNGLSRSDADEDMEEEEEQLAAPVYKRRIISDDEEDLYDEFDEGQDNLVDVEYPSMTNGKPPFSTREDILKSFGDDSDDDDYAFAIVDLNDTTRASMKQPAGHI